MDESSILLQIGVGGTFALLIIREVFGFIRPILEKRRAGPSKPAAPSSPLNGSTKKISAQVDEIKNILQRSDSDGTPLVYVPRSLAEAIHELAQTTAEQTRFLERVNENVIEVRRDLRRLEDK